MSSETGCLGTKDPEHPTFRKSSNTPQKAPTEGGGEPSLPSKTKLLERNTLFCHPIPHPPLGSPRLSYWPPSRPPCTHPPGRAAPSNRAGAKSVPGIKDRGWGEGEGEGPRTKPYGDLGPKRPTRLSASCPELRTQSTLTLGSQVTRDGHVGSHPGEGRVRRGSPPRLQPRTTQDWSGLIGPDSRGSLRSPTQLSGGRSRAASPRRGSSSLCVVPWGLEHS